MNLQLVGIDCATEDKKVGVAFGQLKDTRLVVERAFTCNKEASAAKTISENLLKTEDPALLAIDAPLGWPQTLSRVLAKHRAGEELNVEPNDMFRRATDKFIKVRTRKTALDVGADRIARTAFAALKLLGDMRRQVGVPIPLAWEWPPTERLSAIEVYPAATLVAHKFRSGGYKKMEHIAARNEIIDSIRPFADFHSDVLDAVSRNPDALDAVICLVAARDFLLGKAMSPEDRVLAETEIGRAHV